MRKVLSAAAFISMLLLSAVAGAQLVNLAMANPISVPPDASTKPPTIAISSPIVNGNNVSINFKVTVGESATADFTLVDTVYYTADWNQNATYVYRFYNFEENIFDIGRTEFSYNLNITAVPEGNHTITVVANEYGSYQGGYAFSITGFSSVNFTIDTTPPNVTVLYMDSVTYDTSDVPLNFTTSEPASQISYVLDGHRNVTINGNTTLTGLTDGLHNVTVYVWDVAGNVGVSETVPFIVAEEPFPAAPVAAASAATIAVVGAVLLVYFRRRSHRAEKRLVKKP